MLVPVSIEVRRKQKSFHVKSTELWMIKQFWSDAVARPLFFLHSSFAGAYQLPIETWAKAAFEDSHSDALCTQRLKLFILEYHKLKKKKFRMSLRDDV